VRKTGWSLSVLLAAGPLFAQVSLGPPGAAAPSPAETVGAAKPSAEPAGPAAADFSLKDLKGVPVAVSGLKGKVVFIEFWASWCPPCRKSIPHLNELHRKYGPKGLTILGVNAGETEDQARKFAAEAGIEYAVLLDPEGAADEKYPGRYIPRGYLIGRDGSLLRENVHPSMLDDQTIEAALSGSLEAEAPSK